MLSFCIEAKRQLNKYMMPPSEEGFYQRSRSGSSYLSVLGVEDSQGRPAAVFAEKVAEGSKDAVSRLNKNKKLVWERYHDGVFITITSCYIKNDAEYGNQLCIRGNSKTIQVPMNSAHAKGFIACSGNIDLSQAILFEPYRIARKDQNDKPMLDSKGSQKYTTGWTIKQGGETKEDKVPPSIDMSKNGPVPPFNKLKNGKWDTSDHDEFLANMLVEWIEENQLNKREQGNTTPIKPEEDDEEEEEEEEEEDKPIKKAKATVINSSPLKKKKKKIVEDDDDDDDNVPY